MTNVQIIHNVQREIAVAVLIDLTGDHINHRIYKTVCVSINGIDLWFLKFSFILYIVFRHKVLHCLFVEESNPETDDD